MANWVRLWEDMPTDPKWRVIAKKSGATISEVIAVFNMMLINAAASPCRGVLHNWSDEDVAAALDTDANAIERIRTNMNGKVLEGDVLTGWERRQPKREDGSADRARDWRAKKKQSLIESERTRTHANASERPDTDTEKNISPSLRSGDGAKRAHRLPEDWVLPDRFRDAARSRGLSDDEIDRQASRMLNWSRSAKAGAKLDWFRAWLNWIDDAPRRQEQARHGPQARRDRGSISTLWLEMETMEAEHEQGEGKIGHGNDAWVSLLSVDPG